MPWRRFWQAGAARIDQSGFDLSGLGCLIGCHAQRRPAVFPHHRPLARLSAPAGAGTLPHRYPGGACGAALRHHRRGDAAAARADAVDYRPFAGARVRDPQCAPGGSPAQSHLILRRIRQLAAEKKMPVLAFIEDVGASGGYMLACAGDEIICDQYSIVGSIGAVGGSFGFPKLMDKLGIERRLYTSGERKVMLDPFLPEKPEDVKRIKAIQKDIHEHFIALVKERRGARLHGSDKALFSGEFWTAQPAIELGLADRIGDMRSTLRERYGEKVRTPLIAAERSFFGRKLPSVSFADAPANHSGLADDLLSALEARALWSRYGL